MTEATNADVVPAEAPKELKSTDTSVAAKIVKAAEAQPEKIEKAPEPAQAVPPEGDDADDAPAADSPKEKKEQRLPRWMKERLERERQVTAARTRAEVEREFLARQPQQPSSEPAREEPKAKTLEDFDFDHNAYTSYLVDQKLEAREREQRESAERQKQADAVESFKSKIDAFEARVGAGAWEDIESSRINQDPAFKPLVDMFLGDIHDLDIAHHLASNPQEADRLLSLPPLQRARELGKLAERFEGESVPNVTASQPPKKLTNAPPPAKTVSGAGKASVDINSPDLTPAQRIALWKRGK